MTSLHRIRSLFELMDEPRVSRDVGKKGHSRFLTTLDENVTINTIRGDSESVVKIPPHLDSGLWPVYLEEMQMRYEPAPTDGRQEAAGGPPQK